MKIDIITTFVNMFNGPFEESIIKRAQDAGLVEINVRNLRDWTHDRHHKTDDEQYGGGDGMVMLAEPLIEAVEDLQTSEAVLIFPTPQGKLYHQSMAESLSKERHLIIICGHYKGLDQRVIDYFKPREISIGDYVLTGGELPAMVMVDSIVRLIPGAVNSIASVEEDSITSGLLDCPRYTRPREVRNMEVPDVLLGGNHAEIEKWRYEQSLRRTMLRRPDLYSEHLIKEGKKRARGGKKKV